MTPKRAVVLIGSLVSLAGCAEPPKYLDPVGMSQDQARRERYECQRDAMMLPPSPDARRGGLYGQSAGWHDLAMKRELLNRCLESKGFQRVE